MCYRCISAQEELQYLRLSLRVFKTCSMMVTIRHEPHGAETALPICIDREQPFEDFFQNHVRTVQDLQRHVCRLSHAGGKTSWPVALRRALIWRDMRRWKRKARPSRGACAMKVNSRCVTFGNSAVARMSSGSCLRSSKSMKETYSPIAGLSSAICLSLSHSSIYSMRMRRKITRCAGTRHARHTREHCQRSYSPPSIGTRFAIICSNISIGHVSMDFRM
jgi:hypothetical protein